MIYFYLFLIYELLMKKYSMKKARCASPRGSVNTLCFGNRINKEEFFPSTTAIWL